MEEALSNYLLANKEAIYQWIIQFLELHNSDPKSKLKQECAITLENTLTIWREILNIDGPLFVFEGEEDQAQQTSSAFNQLADSQQPSEANPGDSPMPA